jgi:hypothetical protein
MIDIQHAHAAGGGRAVRKALTHGGYRHSWAANCPRPFPPDDFPLPNTREVHGTP